MAERQTTHRYISNPAGCADPRERGDRTCVACYWSHVNDRNQWCGTDECWNSGCLTPDDGRAATDDRRGCARIAVRARELGIGDM